MTIVKTPDREYRLGENPPPLPQKVANWPWGNTPSLTKWSLDALKYPLGTIILDTIDGHPVIVQIQTHDRYGAHPEWGIKLHKGTSVFVPVTTDDAGRPVAVRDPPNGWGVSPIAGWPHGRLVDRHEERWGENRGALARLGGEHMDRWREHVTKVPKLAVIAGTTILGALVSPIGAAVGFVVGLVLDREVRGGDWLPSFHGDGTWKVYRYAPTTGNFVYLAMVNAGTEGEAMDAATSQVFSASAAKPYSLPGFTSVYITSQGDVFRLGLSDSSGMHGDFGIGTIIPASGQLKSYQLTDHGTHAQVQVQGKSADDAANRAMASHYAGATTVMRLPGTNTFQTDRGDTFDLDMVG